jgi:hypothetical protein
MLWSLLVSCYVIYLYRKLNAEQKFTAVPASSGGSEMAAMDAELAKLNERIAALEGRVSAASTQERAS